MRSSPFTLIFTLLIAILPIIFGFNEWEKITDNDYSTLIKIGLLLLYGGIVAILALFQYEFDNFFSSIYYSIKKRYSAYIYHRIKMRIELLDDSGDEVVFQREDLIRRLSLRYKGAKKYMVEIGDGSIDFAKTNTINSTFKRISDQGVQVSCDISKKNLVQWVHYSTITSYFNNAFSAETEFFVISVDNYCKVLEFKVVAPLGYKFKNPRVEQRIRKSYERDDEEKLAIDKYKDSDTNLFHPSDKSVLSGVKYGKNIILVTLLGVMTNCEYKVCWDKA